MDESSSTNPDQDKEIVREFVLTWGEMASSWGINKTMAQIHALLYIVEQPWDTDSIMSELQISRGNANMNIRNLVQWGLLHKVHYAGQRKDYYTAEKNVWATAAAIIKERQQREIEPLKNNLKELQTKIESGDDHEDQQVLQQRVESVIHFLDLFEEFTESILPFVSQRNTASIKRLAKIARMAGKSDETSLPDESDLKK